MSKVIELKKVLARLGSVVIAFSGGVDSSFLLRMAKDNLPKENILAVTAVSETYTKSELKQAKRFAKDLGVRHKIIHTNELKDENFTKNPVNRCYYCKKELFKELNRIKKENGFSYVLDASNSGDEKITLFVKIPYIASVEPAVPQCFSGSFGFIVKPCHYRAAGNDFPLLPGG